MYIVTIFYITKVLLRVWIHPHHLQGVLTFYFAEVIKIISVIN